MQYTTLANLKEYLGIEDTTRDNILNKIITKTTKLFDKYLWQNLWEKTYWEFLWEIFDDYVLFPSKTPISSVTEVRVDDIPVIVKRFIEDIIYLNESMTWEVFIEYKAGFKTLDEIADVEEACLKLCKKIYLEISWEANENIKSEKIDDLQVTYFSENEKDKSFNYTEILDRYRANTPNLI